MSLELSLKTPLGQLKRRAVWASDIGEYWFCACKILHAQSFGSEPTPEMDEGRAIHEAVSEADIMTMIQKGLESKPVEVKTIQEQIELNKPETFLILQPTLINDS